MPLAYKGSHFSCQVSPFFVALIIVFIIIVSSTTHTILHVDFLSVFSVYCKFVFSCFSYPFQGYSLFGFLFSRSKKGYNTCFFSFRFFYGVLLVFHVFISGFYSAFYVVFFQQKPQKRMMFLQFFGWLSGGYRVQVSYKEEKQLSFF